MTSLAFEAPEVGPGVRRPAADLDGLVQQMAKSQSRQAAFAELYRCLYGLVFDYAGWVLTEPGAAERVARGAFVEAWHRAPYYRASEGGVEGWILAIAHRRIGEAGRLRPELRTATYDEHITLELASLLTAAQAATTANWAARAAVALRSAVRQTGPSRHEEHGAGSAGIGVRASARAR